MARGKRRRNAPKQEYRELDYELLKISAPRREFKRGIEYEVRGTAGKSDDPGKFWICPNCSLEIEPGTNHMVAWDVHRGIETRRHFHNHCWKMFQGRLD